MQEQNIMCTLSARAFVISVLATSSGGIAQGVVEDVSKLLQGRDAPVVDIFDGAFGPDTLFRGRTLTDWLLRLRDADLEFNQTGRDSFLAMGERAVPFLVACEDSFDWSDCSTSPLQLLKRMGEEAVTPLVNLLESRHTFLAWMALNCIISRHDAILMDYSVRGKSPPREWLSRVLAERSRTMKVLLPTLGSNDACTRYFGLKLLQRVASHAAKHEQEQLTNGARRILNSDPRTEVRAAACELLAMAGVQRVAGGLTRSEAEDMLNDRTTPDTIRQAALMRVVLEEMERRAEAPKPSTGK